MGSRQRWIEGHNKESMKEREYVEAPEAPQKFDAVMRKILSVSKEELKKREKAWKRKRAKKKRAIS